MGSKLSVLNLSSIKVYCIIRVYFVVALTFKILKLLFYIRNSERQFLKSIIYIINQLKELWRLAKRVIKNSIHTQYIVIIVVFPATSPIITSFIHTDYLLIRIIIIFIRSTRQWWSVPDLPIFIPPPPPPSSPIWQIVVRLVSNTCTFTTMNIFSGLIIRSSISCTRWHRFGIAYSVFCSISSLVQYSVWFMRLWKPVDSI